MNEDPLARAVATIAKLLAPALAKELAPLLVPDRGSDYVTRRTAGISGRRWDAWVKSGALRVYRDGRRYCAKRADLAALLERETKFAPRCPPPRKPRGTDEALLASAGVHLHGDD